MVAGVDGCPKGWIAVVLGRDGFERAVFGKDLRELLTRVSGATVVGVDMPIGLPEAGSRRADLEARDFLGARRSTLFEVPPRQVLAAPTHAEAVAISKRLIGKGISRQSYGLRAKIAEVQELLGNWGDQLREVHPETSFQLMAGESLTGKRTFDGQARRRALLEAEGIRVPETLGGDEGAVPVDDVLDAAAAAWSARRIAAGEARSFPDPPERIGDRDVAIWC